MAPARATASSPLCSTLKGDGRGMNPLQVGERYSESFDYSMSVCEFCEEITTKVVPVKYRALTGMTNRIVYSTETFSVVPSLSPIRLNHLLIIPHMHVTSISQLPARQIDELKSIQDVVLSKLRLKSGLQMVVFEHGIGEGATGGCGVSHCHQHCIPLTESEVESVIARFADSDGSAAQSLPTESQSYVMLSVPFARSPFHGVKVGEYPSQYLRNMIEHVLGIPRTNWRDMSNMEIFGKVLEEFAC